jgi:hypothetical protein
MNVISDPDVSLREKIDKTVEFQRKDTVVLLFSQNIIDPSNCTVPKAPCLVWVDFSKSM